MEAGDDAEEAFDPAEDLVEEEAAKGAVDKSPERVSEEVDVFAPHGFDSLGALLNELGALGGVFAPSLSELFVDLIAQCLGGLVALVGLFEGGHLEEDLPGHGGCGDH